MIERYWKIYYSNRVMFKTEMRVDLNVNQAIQLDKLFREKFSVSAGYSVEHAWREYLQYNVIVE